MNEPKGAMHWKAKLFDEDVRLIRQLYREGMSQGELSRKFDVSWSTIHDVCIYKTWKHIL